MVIPSACSQSQNRVKLTLLRCQQRTAVYLWILFLRKVMPRTPPPGQGKKLESEKHYHIWKTAQETLLCLYLEICSSWMPKCQWNSTGHGGRIKSIIDVLLWFFENSSHINTICVPDCSINTQVAYLASAIRTLQRQPQHKLISFVDTEEQWFS